MKTSRVALLSALLCAGAAMPALADWDGIGVVRLHRSQSQTVDLGGPVMRLRLQAEESDVRCRAVRATFANGRTKTIFSGRLREGRPSTVDLPGNLRRISRLAFECDTRGNEARIRVFADIGDYRSDWRRGPNWHDTWAKMFNWGSNEIYDWKYLGQERFEGRRDREEVFVGWKGRGSQQIALKPVDANARCSRVSATFANGGERALNIRNGDYLSRGMYHMIDLPGDRRNVTRLALTCRAVDARAVTIQIYTSK